MEKMESDRPLRSVRAADLKLGVVLFHVTLFETLIISHSRDLLSWKGFGLSKDRHR